MRDNERPVMHNILSMIVDLYNSDKNDAKAVRGGTDYLIRVNRPFLNVLPQRVLAFII